MNRDLIRIINAMLENRNVNITSQFVRIFKVFEDIVFTLRLKEDLSQLKLQTNT